MDRNFRLEIQQYCTHMKNLTGISCYVVDLSVQPHENALCSLCDACEQYVHYECSGWQAARKGCLEARRWSGPYMALCPCGLLLVTTSILDQSGAQTGGITTEPLCVGAMEDNLQLVTSHRLRKVISLRPCYHMEQLQGLAGILEAVSSSLSKGIHHSSAQYLTRQQQAVNQEYVKRIRAMEGGDIYLYPIALERKLRVAVNNRDRNGSMVLLNQILAYIYTASNFNLELIKIRTQELLTVISRSAADAGADFTQLQLQGDHFRASLEGCQSLESLSAWLSSILQEYISATFDLKKDSHRQIIRWVREYVEAHYQEKIQLADIAAEVHLSSAYLCTVYKEDTGESISSYINRTRIGHACTLLQDPELNLTDISSLCGFEEQSYFTKVFRSYTGVTPRKYRQGILQELPTPSSAIL